MKKRNWFFAFGGIGSFIMNLFTMFVVMILYVMVASCREIGASLSGSEVNNTQIEIIASGLVFVLLILNVFAIITTVRGFARKIVPLVFVIIQLVGYVLIIGFITYSLFTSDGGKFGGIMLLLCYAGIVAIYILGVLHQIKYSKSE